MPWYKLELTGGRAHANHEVKYVWTDLKWNAAEKDAQWHAWTREFGYERMWDGHVTYVKRLPAKVRREIIETYRGRVERANEMLRRLNAD